jgi:hypothetical protein
VTRKSKKKTVWLRIWSYTHIYSFFNFSFNIIILIDSSFGNISSLHSCIQHLHGAHRLPQEKEDFNKLLSEARVTTVE